MSCGIFATVLLASIVASEGDFVFDLTDAKSTCGDFLRTEEISSESLKVIYQPLNAFYSQETFNISRKDIAFSTSKFYFERNFRSNKVRTNSLIRLSTESDYPSIKHLFIPYNGPNLPGQLTFIVPFVETTGTNCFEWPSVLKAQNNTSEGLITFATNDTSRKFYYFGKVQFCGEKEISRVLGSVRGEANLTGIPSKIFPLNTNCDTPGVSSLGVFVNGIGWNFCFWLLFGTLLFIGVYSVASDSEVKPDPKQRNNWLTHYPLYSIHYAASEHYTRTSRMVLLSVAWAAIVFFEALLVGLLPRLHLALKLVVIPLAAALFALFFEFIAGFILSRAYAVNRKFVDEMRTAQSIEDRLKAQEAWESSQYRAYFLFYLVAGVLIVGLICGGTVLLNGLWRDVQALWLLGLAIGVSWLLFVLDPLLAITAKVSPAVHRLLRLRGYWFDFDAAHAIDSYHLQ